MIINKQHRFIYIHVPRTGGTSIRQAWKDLDKNGLVDHSCKIGRMRKKHVTVRELRCVGKLNDCEFDRYFKFGFIRNPWDRVYSLYCKHREQSDINCKKGFKYWLFDELQLHQQFQKRPAWHFLRGVDYVARFESFEKEWDYIFDKVGMPRIDIPHLFKYQEAGTAYRDLYDDEMRAFITRYHYEDIERGEYTF